MSYSKKISILFISVFVSGFLLVAAPVVHAMTPTLSLSTLNPSDGDTVVLTVNGDANAPVFFYYIKVGVGITPISNNWVTNSSGYFSTSISTSSYQVTPSSSVYVTTGGLNGSHSNSVLWPISTSSTTSGTISLSQTGVVLAAGQSATVTASGVSGLYLSNNSNPPIANINVSGTSINISAITNGNTVATVCSTSSTSTCSSIYITVQNSGTQALTFGQSNVTIVPGQNVPISISGGNGIYMVQNNPNSAVVQASISGSTITLSTTSTSGASSITVCSTDMSSCGIINVTVGTASSSVISFSPENPVVSVGQGTSVTISGASGGVYYISSNSNPSVAQVTISSNILTIIGNTNGSSVMSVCSSVGSCGSLTVTVNYTSSGGTISLSQTSLTLLTGQTLSIVISGGTAPYNVVNNSSNIAQTTINGNILTVYGAGVGSEILPVCSAGGGCVSLSILVNGSGTSTQLILGQTSLSLTAGQNTTVSISGSGGYYISNNSNSGVASAQISGSSVIVDAIVSGSDNISICQSTGQCANLPVTVSASSIPVVPIIQPSATAYVFSRGLGYGEKGDDVLFLQTYLLEKGYLTATPTGHYGAATVEAVKKFQAANDIKQTGSVGPITRNLLNQLQIPSTNSANSTTSGLTNQQQITQLQTLLQVLQTMVQQTQAKITALQ